jgi:macrodomain Ter protein organizer (MatP/YcbG family)
LPTISESKKRYKILQTHTHKESIKLGWSAFTTLANYYANRNYTQLISIIHDTMKSCNTKKKATNIKTMIF